MTLSKLCRRGGPKSGGNCKYTTFPGTHAPNRSGQQEGGELSQRRDPPTVPLLSSSASGQLDSSITRSAGICHPGFFILTFLFWNVFSGQFYSGIVTFDIYGAQLFVTFMSILDTSENLQIKKVLVTVSKFFYQIIIGDTLKLNSDSGNYLNLSFKMLRC